MLRDSAAKGLSSGKRVYSLQARSSAMGLTSDGFRVRGCRGQGGAGLCAPDVRCFGVWTGFGFWLSCSCFTL